MNDKLTVAAGADWELPSLAGGAADGRFYSVVNPATQDVFARVPDCGEEEAQRLLEACVSAFDSWKQTTAFQRSQLLRKWFERIVRGADEVASAISQEMGKPIKEALGEVMYAAGFAEWYAEEAKRVYGETFSSQHEHKRLYASRQPVGPVFAVTPWNFPAAMITRKVAPALAAGCTVIVKPAEQSPITAILLEQYWREVGGPEGTFQVITSNQAATVSAVYFKDRRVRKLTFTGSTEVGVLLYRQSAETMKRVSLELGGHAPFIVFADADIPRAVDDIMACKFRNAGQTCVCTNRIYVHRSISSQLLEALAARVQELRVGDPADDATQIGPLVDEQGLRKVSEHVADALSRGASVVVGGQALGGLYYQPTVLRDVAPGMRILEEETFGPVAPVIEFDTLDEVVAAANDTPYGLAAYLWTRDLDTAHRVSERLDYGIVGINDGAPSTAQAPFGGVKMSGIGREGGVWGIQEYLDTKFVSVGLAPR
ncbi:succinate-semialdehyde dehydrogenase/glutarate-semialdehyde dehydrogenase [Pseudomonas nitritireducens]|uniref:Succinate-semialdehyde dehydrogenase/glutarate-semialdehyde dehydrogenase n=1 Tax=Pseudomonas nitroreducens TaxID=46680 RepID=A0A7W7KLD2_PSENT|nr:NAD-dependent succinate-semialdehyde dehydrogenase [Pseudomonas nitritireducens]MBB4864914.1 succinate-semialdehyde dehydrogenase/glutarate-semialdehyde dehydrogenase [Pseudomonas nitritireducens]